MEHEEEFLGALRSVTVHLIKHDQPLYKKLVKIVEFYDSGTWFGLPTQEKMGHVAAVEETLAELDQYYEGYQHHWSRERFKDMKRALSAFRTELQGKS